MRVLRKAAVPLLFVLAGIGCARRTAPTVMPVVAPAAVVASADISQGWKLHKGDDPAWRNPALDETDWRAIEVGKPWETQGLSDYDGYAWYRLRFRLPGALRRTPDFQRHQALLLNLGYIDDVDETYLNGSRIGATGAFPDSYATAWQANRRYRIPAHLLYWDADNVLAVRVYDGQGDGGMYAGKCALAAPTWRDLFTLELDQGRGDGIFPTGGAPRFAAAARNETALRLRGEVRWKIEDDEGKTLATNASALSVAPGRTIETVSDFAPVAPGFYKATCTFESDGGGSVSTSMILGFKPEALDAPLTRRPDFTEFWLKTRQALGRVDPQFKMIPQPDRATETHELFLVEMRSLGNVLVRGWYERPKAPGAHPALLRVPGYTSSMRPSRSADPIATLSFNIRAHGNSQDDVKGLPADYWVRGLDDKQGYFYQGAYMDCVRAVDFLVSRPEIDPSRIAVTGGSQGGGLSLAVAGLDRRIAFCAPDIPFLCNWEKYFKASHWPEIDNWIAAKPERSWKSTLRTMSYFDALNFAPNVKCPVYLGLGLQDKVCPAATIFGVYNRLPGPKEYHVQPHAGHGLGGEHYPNQRAWLLRQFERAK